MEMNYLKSANEDSVADLLPIAIYLVCRLFCVHLLSAALSYLIRFRLTAELCANTSLGFCWKRSLSGGYRVTALVTNLDCFRSRAVSPFWRGGNPDSIVHELTREFRNYTLICTLIFLCHSMSHCGLNGFYIQEDARSTLELRNTIAKLNHENRYIFMQIILRNINICTNLGCCSIYSRNVQSMYISRTTRCLAY